LPIVSAPTGSDGYNTCTQNLKLRKWSGGYDGDGTKYYDSTGEPSDPLTINGLYFNDKSGFETIGDLILWPQTT
jgi:hypothetical protein